MAHCLALFVDSLPHYYLPQTRVLKQFECKASLRPGFGYSVNIHAEMFSGLRPDQVGFLSEWAVSPSTAPGRYLRPYLQLFEVLGKSYILDRVMRRGLQRVIGYTGYVPFRYLHLLARTGRFPHERDYSFSTVFTDDAGGIEIYPRVQKRLRRDGDVVEQIKDKIPDGGLIVGFFEDLDWVGHYYGVGSQEYRDYIRQLDNWIEELWGIWSKRHPVGRFLIFSDHGMANTTGEVDLQLERHCGPAGLSTYLYVKDSTMCRVWSYSEKNRKVLAEYLQTVPGGRLVTEEERKRFGIASRACGDLIYLVDDGMVLNPSFFGARAPKAMHGHHPDLPSQQGVLLGRNTPELSNHIYEAIEVYDLLRRIREA